MAEFIDSFAERKPRESAGARSSNRFDYQKNWAFCELIDLQLKDDDYLMVFEHHEDIVVLNSASSPTSAKFYQVKSKKTGNWTINSLVKNETNDDLSSIVGKLYGNLNLFPDNTKKLVFTSNQGLSNKLKCGSKGLDFDIVSFKQLAIADKEKVWEAIKGDNHSYCDLIGLSKFFLVKSPLRLEDHEQLTKGKLVDFFNTLFPERPAHIALAYQTIFDEIRRKTNFEDIPKNSDELKKRKSISRTEFSHMTGLVAQSRTSSELWLEAVQHLSACGVGPLVQNKLKRFWDTYTVDRMNVSNEQLLAIQKEIRHTVAMQLKMDENAAMDTLMEATLTAVKDKSGYSDDYIKAATIYEVINYDPISSANSKFEGKTE